MPRQDPVLRFALTPLKVAAKITNPQGYAYQRSAGPAGTNVDRIVAAAAELLGTFGYAQFVRLAESKIRANLNEERGRYALERIHQLTRPPYR